MNSDQPTSGEGSGTAGECLNCGAPLAGPYCAECGQKHTELNVPLRQLLSEFAGNIFTFDSRFFRSFVPLLIRPGFLTQKFNAGQRASFIPPLRLYLFISILGFFAITMTDPQFFKATVTEGTAQEVAAAAPEPSSDSKSARPDTLAQLTPLENRLQTNLIKARDNQKMINDIISERLPQLMFLLLPVFAMYLYVIYRKNGMYYVNHLIFGLHFHSFAFFVFLLISLAFIATGTPYGGLLAFTMPVYLLVAMQRVYGGAFWKTLLRFAALGFFYLLTLAAALFILAFGTIFFLD